MTQSQEVRVGRDEATCVVARCACCGGIMLAIVNPLDKDDRSKVSAAAAAGYKVETLSVVAAREDKWFCDKRRRSTPSSPASTTGAGSQASEVCAAPQGDL